MKPVKIGIGLLLVASVIGTSCASRAPRSGLAARQRPVTVLRGFFGNDTFVDVVKTLLITGMKGSPLPDGWKGEIPLETYSQEHHPFYVDSDLTGGTGEDSDPQHGLERATLSFFAGHGQDGAGWFVPKEDLVPLGEVRLGDEALRYLWLYSCNVLAHGPKEVGGRLNYSAPQCPRSDSTEGTDAFKGWTPAFARSMRMVCGGSTTLGHRGVEDIWSYLLASEISVADAWSLGLAHPKEVTACLARGGKDPVSSALRDRTLLQKKVKEKGWLHYQYPIGCTFAIDGLDLRVSCNKPSICSTLGPPVKPKEESPIPSWAPKVSVQTSVFPHLDSGGDLPLGFVRVHGSNERLKVQPKSGALVLAKRQGYRDQYTPLASCDSATNWTVHLRPLLARAGLGQGPGGRSFNLASFSITVLEMRVESRRDLATSGSCAARSLFLLLSKRVAVGPDGTPVFGPPVLFELQRHGESAAAALTAFSVPDREPTVEPDMVELAKVPDVILETREALQLKPEEYPVDKAHVVFGYEEAPLWCQQRYLRPTYEIQFVPSEDAQANRPIVTVRVDARQEKTPDTDWTCDSWGDFPPP